MREVVRLLKLDSEHPNPDNQLANQVEWFCSVILEQQFLILHFKVSGRSKWVKFSGRVQSMQFRGVFGQSAMHISFKEYLSLN